MNVENYNIIPIGDHCAISILLKELNVRSKSYPFDWVTHIEPLHNTNIIYNMNIINELHTTNSIENIVKHYIGDTFDNSKRINSSNNIWFPHELENLSDTLQKYERRFTRLKEDLHKKNLFILLTRHYYIENNVFQKIMEQLLHYNNDSKILFISGTNHTYFESLHNDRVIFKYIEYDISKYYDYDYTNFRPNLKEFLSNFLTHLK
jgi:hypothetical protein